MSDQQPTPFWKKLPNLLFNRFNGHSGCSTNQENKPDEHYPLSVFHNEYDIDKLAMTLRRILLSQALVYRERIEGLVGAYPSVRGRDILLPIASQVEECVGGLYRLAVRSEPPAPVAAVDADPMPHESATVTPAEAKSSDEATVRLPIPPHDVELLAEQQFEDTLTALGTVYSLMLLLEGKDVEERTAQRLHDLLSSQVILLNRLAPPADTAPPAE